MEFFIARQPVFDREQRVYAYELLFRSGIKSIFNISENSNGDGYSPDVVTNSFFFIGLEELTGGKKACINFTRELLLQEVPLHLPGEKTIVGISETVDPTPEILGACRKFKKNGYGIVLGNANHLKEDHPLIEVVDFVKVDFREIAPEVREKLPEALEGSGLKFLAEKIETEDEYHQALESGYSLFQGYYFSEPELQSGGSIDSSKHNYLQIIQEINKPDVEYDALESIIKRDLGLTYKLLRFINSAYFGIITEVRSIRQALVLLGFEEIRKWASLLALQKLGEGKPSELLRQSIIRARFCEELGAEIGMEEERSELFLMGMFTVLSALMEKPMAQILTELPLDKAIHAALLGRQNKYRRILETVLAYERGRWDQFTMFIRLLHVEEDAVPALYRSAIQWSDQVLDTKALQVNDAQ